jgi:hypothetical protein
MIPPFLRRAVHDDKSRNAMIDILENNFSHLMSREKMLSIIEKFKKIYSNLYEQEISDLFVLNSIYQALDMFFKKTSSYVKAQDIIFSYYDGEPSNVEIAYNLMLYDNGKWTLPAYNIYNIYCVSSKIKKKNGFRIRDEYHNVLYVLYRTLDMESLEKLVDECDVYQLIDIIGILHKMELIKKLYNNNKEYFIWSPRGQAYIRNRRNSIFSYPPFVYYDSEFFTCDETDRV